MKGWFHKDIEASRRNLFYLLQTEEEEYSKRLQNIIPSTEQRQNELKLKAERLKKERFEYEKKLAEELSYKAWKQNSTDLHTYQHEVSEYFVAADNQAQMLAKQRKEQLEREEEEWFEQMEKEEAMRSEKMNLLRDQKIKSNESKWTDDVQKQLEIRRVEEEKLRAEEEQMEKEIAEHLAKQAEIEDERTFKQLTDEMWAHFYSQKYNEAIQEYREIQRLEEEAQDREFLERQQAEYERDRQYQHNKHMWEREQAHITFLENQNIRRKHDESEAELDRLLAEVNAIEIAKEDDRRRRENEARLRLLADVMEHRKGALEEKKIEEQRRIEEDRNYANHLQIQLENQKKKEEQERLMEFERKEKTKRELMDQIAEKQRRYEEEKRRDRDIDEEIQQSRLETDRRFQYEKSLIERDLNNARRSLRNKNIFR
eukprot:TRINITY_DN2643_c0_g1_i2.p1 TRINITY_DN2643_c0_g1~~TRINITY_DN2643_c0_g1_i2.p1  ORF type:complete len:428 (-),score=153.41 TRINITY_DN2643_c0_g1_i2:1242-2525(-)